MTEIHVLIVTAGASPLLPRTLQSLADCNKPANFSGVIVVDLQANPATRAACEHAPSHLRVDYRTSATANKSDALNQTLSALPTDSLVIFSDDDILYTSGVLTAYARAAQVTPSGTFFGGPFTCEYESVPAPAVVPLLPLTAVGWTPHPSAFHPKRDTFLGFNWAAINRDIQRLGGFDRSLGPGSPNDAIGHDLNMQKRLQAAGLNAQLVEDALVHHFVPADRCSTEWACQRARRHGVSYGVARRDQSVTDIALTHWKFTLQLFANTAARLLTSPLPKSGFHIRARYRQQKAIGYFRGFRVPSQQAINPVA